MLVLTRKAKEQILIGEDIKITIVRLQGNSVRIGIDAPREQRVIRGELEPSGLESDPSGLAECESAELADQHRVFAHPQPNPSRISRAAKSTRIPAAAQLFVGQVDRDGTDPALCRAPLADFMSAT
ncbi:MAG: carbon storage regulator [Planctomycetota bacterium]|nr:carbon storage regulator [Planctomycetota bacterium]